MCMLYCMLVSFNKLEHAISANLITFIGIDLAWSPRNLTGAAVLRGDAGGAELIDHGLLGDDSSIAEYIARHAGEAPAIVAVDAARWVPYATVRRPGAGEVARCF